MGTAESRHSAGDPLAKRAEPFDIIGRFRVDMTSSRFVKLFQMLLKSAHEHSRPSVLRDCYLSIPGPFRCRPRPNLSK